MASREALSGLRSVAGPIFFQIVAGIDKRHRDVWVQTGWGKSALDVRTSRRGVVLPFEADQNDP